MGKPVSPYTLPGLAPGEATSAFCTALLGRESNRGEAVTGSKSSLDWHRARCQESLQTVGGAVYPYGIAIAPSNWAAPTPVNKVLSRHLSPVLLG